MTKEIDHEYTEMCVCPYCGQGHEDYGNGPLSGEVQCYSCNKRFHSEPDYSVSYSTRKLDCLNGLAEHNWSFDKWYSERSQKDYFRCRVCDKSEFREKK